MSKQKRDRFRRRHYLANPKKRATCPLCATVKPLTLDEWVSIGDGLLHVYSCRECVDRRIQELQSSPPSSNAAIRAETCIQRHIDDATKEWSK